MVLEPSSTRRRGDSTIMKCTPVRSGEPDPGASFDMGWRKLMSKMIISAYRDILFGEPAQQFDAFGWLLTDGPLYCEALGMPEGDPLNDMFNHNKQSLRKQVSPWRDK